MSASGRLGCSLFSYIIAVHDLEVSKLGGFGGNVSLRTLDMCLFLYIITAHDLEVASLVGLEC